MREQFYRGNQSLKDKVFALDFTLIFLVLILGIISIFAMYSTEQGQYGYYTKSHLYRFSTFFLLFIIISFFNIQYIYKFSYFFYILILILLIAVDSFGITSSGSKRWINLFFINLQPSELMKVALIVFLARYYNKIPSQKVNSIKHIFTTHYFQMYTIFICQLIQCCLI